MAGPYPDSLQHWPIWEEWTAAANEVNPLGLQTWGKASRWAEGFIGSIHVEQQSNSLNRSELAVDQAISRLKQREIAGKTQSGRAILGWRTALKTWSKVTRKERKELVISEVVRTEEEFENLCIEKSNEGKQWQKKQREGVITSTIGWANMWRFPKSFLIRSTYGTLPSPSNLCLWCGSESCPKSKPAAWQDLLYDDEVMPWPLLRKLEKILEVCRLVTTRKHLWPTPRQLVHLVREGGGAYNVT